MTTRIAIVEDHKVVAEALSTMLSLVEDFEVVGTTSSGSEALALVEATDPDVILMDINLEGLNGIEATREILKKRPESRILILSMHDDHLTVTSAVAAGAAGFLPKNVDRDELVTAINAVSQGKGFLAPDVTRPFLSRIGNLAEEVSARERLTDREREVLEELAQGKSTREMAEALVVAEETIKTHLTHIYQKLGVSDRVQAVALALRRGLVR